MAKDFTSLHKKWFGGLVIAIDLYYIILDGVVLQTSGSPTKAVRASVLEAGVAEARFTKGLIFVAEMLAFVSKGSLCSQTYSIMFYPGSRCRHIF